jgi:hypothetical protein
MKNVRQQHTSIARITSTCRASRTHTSSQVSIVHNAVLIKRFLTSLAEPLFPFDTYRKLAMINCEDPGCVSTVREIVKTLPLLNFTTLMFLLKFFVEEIIPRHEQNKMTSYNSAVVLLPCLLWSEMRTLDDLTLGKNLAKVLEQILVNF